MTSCTRALRRSFQTSACSLPPDPTTSIRISWTRLRFVQIQGFQIGTEFSADFLILERKLHGSLEKSEFFAGIVAFAAEFVGKDALFRRGDCCRPSVNWISPPAPRSVFSRTSKMPGVRM